MRLARRLPSTLRSARVVGTSQLSRASPLALQGIEEVLGTFADAQEGTRLRTTHLVGWRAWCEGLSFRLAG